MFNDVGGNVDDKLAEKGIKLPLEVVTLKVASFTDPESGTLKTKMGIDVKNYTDAAKPTIDAIPENLTTELDADTNMSVSQLLGQTETPILKASREFSKSVMGTSNLLYGTRTLSVAITDLNNFKKKVSDEKSTSKIDKVLMEIRKVIAQDPKKANDPLKSYTADGPKVNFGMFDATDQSDLAGVSGEDFIYGAFHLIDNAVKNKKTVAVPGKPIKTIDEAKAEVSTKLGELAVKITSDKAGAGAQKNKIENFYADNSDKITLKNYMNYNANIDKLIALAAVDGVVLSTDKKSVDASIEKRITPFTLVGSLFGSKGGKRSRKHKKSKTMKGGRRHKKTRKH